MEGGLSTDSWVSREDAGHEIRLQFVQKPKKRDKFKLSSSKSKWKARQVFETHGNKWPARVGVVFASWWWHFPGRWHVGQRDCWAVNTCAAGALWSRRGPSAIFYAKKSGCFHWAVPCSSARAALLTQETANNGKLFWECRWGRVSVHGHFLPFLHTQK